MPTQRYDSRTVLEAARERIARVFDLHDEVCVSISGGKDSTVLAHLALIEARKRGRRVNLFFLDEEVVYQSTVDQVEYLMTLYPDATNEWWLQVPFRLTNASSTTESQLNAWEPGRHKVWMRTKRATAIKAKPWTEAQETIGNKPKGFGFYDAIAAFERMFSGAAFLVGLRAAGESPNRWRAVVKNPVIYGDERIYWATRRGANSIMYPIFDWLASDVWRYIHDEQLRYSKVYDWQFRKGYAISEMRVSSFIHEQAFKSICDLPEFEPKTYARLLRRVRGISLVQEAGKNPRLFACRKLPKNFATWRAYRDHLIATYADTEHVYIFQRRFARHRDNEYVARQQVRQLLLDDYENNLSIHDADDPRVALIQYYDEVL